MSRPRTSTNPRADYMRKYQLKWKAYRRNEWINKNGPCLCGSWKDLEVDHVDPSTKVDHNVWSWSNERRSEELAKCQVLCKPCHMIKTSHENGMPLEGRPHGSQNTYQKEKCRCRLCRDANASVERMRRARKSSQASV